MIPTVWRGRSQCCSRTMRAQSGVGQLKDCSDWSDQLTASRCDPLISVCRRNSPSKAISQMCWRISKARFGSPRRQGCIVAGPMAAWRATPVATGYQPTIFMTCSSTMRDGCGLRRAPAASSASRRMVRTIRPWSPAHSQSKMDYR